MDIKKIIRKKYLIKRKKKYFDVKQKFFFPLINILKKKFKNKRIFVSIYYPSFYEVNVLKILGIEQFRKCQFLLPVIESKGTMNFYQWKQEDILYVNKFGILEPSKSKKFDPDVILVPMLAFDDKRNRLGYGKGFYDRYLAKNIKSYKKILTVGVAFSFQKYHKLPVNSNDIKLDYILTEKGIS